MKTLAEYLAVWLKGDAEAINFILEIHKIAATWDALVDGDKDVAASDISAAFYSALLTLPRNGFYRRYFDTLSPLIEVAIIDWHTANAMQARKQGDDLRHAFGLRNTTLSITAMAARIIGGVDWSVQVNLEFRALCESWEKYSAEFGEA